MDDIKCLDKGYVRYVDHIGSDQRVVQAARVCYDSITKGKEQDIKLLHYLWKNKHHSPFEFIGVTLEIKMPLFCARQYFRHRIQSANEVSARYTQLSDDFYIPSVWRKQDSKNKQGSSGEFNSEENSLFSADLERGCQAAYKQYQQMLDAGVSREMARMILPVNIYTTIFSHWNIRSLFHFIELREDGHAQSEMQEYAKAIKQICAWLFPETTKAYEQYKWELVDNGS